MYLNLKLANSCGLFFSQKTLITPPGKKPGEITLTDEEVRLQTKMHWLGQVLLSGKEFFNVDFLLLLLLTEKIPKTGEVWSIPTRC